ncbi:MAG: CDP-diacylglycerol--glycerol-3-phosphate 3-phosphatidyltransferase [Clostridia bacterium]|nr:CDP-diacylglycerol--glycerol-3-phosphate 3-phosphatidyltransferase [Clostridia bacterium]
MNWPNRLSLIRVFCIPVITALLYIPTTWVKWVSAALFGLACLTDFLDGYLARKNHWITDFGKFIDPVADKLLVLSTMVMLVHLQLVPAWLLILILARELSVDGLRLVAMTKGLVIAAGSLGKIKTFSQMLLILALLILRIPLFSAWYGIIAGIWIAGITLISGVDYFRRNLSVILG